MLCLILVQHYDASIECSYSDVYFSPIINVRQSRLWNPIKRLNFAIFPLFPDTKSFLWPLKMRNRSCYSRALPSLYSNKYVVSKGLLTLTLQIRCVKLCTIMNHTTGLSGSYSTQLYTTFTQPYTTDLQCTRKRRKSKEDVFSRRDWINHFKWYFKRK